MAYEPAWHLRGPDPYAVQLEALRRSHNKPRFAYFLEQGLGKTALWLNDYVENFIDEIDTVLILCPNTFKNDWAAAPAEWGLSGINTAVWPHQEMGRRAFNVMNFEAVRSGGYDAIVKLFDKPCALVVDESSAIKNFKSDTARAVLDLAKRASVVRLLNGTPMSQNVMDLFPQLKCVGELNTVNPYAFRNRFAVTGGWMGKQVIGVQNEKELQAILDRCSFRALKKDWSDLPEKINIPLRLEMTNKQRRHYKELMEDFFTLVGGQEFSAQMVISQMDKLRQVASGLLLDGDKCVLLEEATNNPKIRAALDILENGPGKMIIVHYYTKIGDVIYERMRDKGLNPSFIRGGMSPQEVTGQKAKFNNDPSCRVKVAQITASSRAHTLLGGEGNDRAHKMFFHDHTFSLMDRQQMEDRIHRGAQDKACLYYDPILSPIDEAQLKALSKKQDVASAVVDAVRALA